jgi:type-F conjugative transfer system pilin assembly protein TrbC
MAVMRSWLVGLVQLSVCAAALAQSNAPGASRAALPSQQDVSRTIEAQRQQEQATQSAIDSAARRALNSRNPAMQGQPGLPGQLPDVLRMPAPPGAADPAALAQRFRQDQSVPTGLPEERTHRLVAFVSLSMPADSLKRLALDMKKARGVLVLRGLRHGLDAAGWMKSLADLRPLASLGADVEINPGLFQQFEVSSVPTILVIPDGLADKGCTASQCSPGTYAMVRGDVTLEYALNRLGDRRDKVGVFSRKLLEIF